MNYFKFIDYKIVKNIEDAVKLENEYPNIFLGLVDEINWCLNPDNMQDFSFPFIVGLRNLRGNYYIIDTDDLSMYGEDLTYAVKLLLGDRTLEQFIEEKGA